MVHSRDSEVSYNNHAGLYIQWLHTSPLLLVLLHSHPVLSLVVSFLSHHSSLALALLLLKDLSLHIQQYSYDCFIRVTAVLEYIE